MRQISLVGAVDEEVGDYFPEFLDMLEESPFLKVGGRFFIYLYIYIFHWTIFTHALTHTHTRDVYSFRSETGCVLTRVAAGNNVFLLRLHGASTTGAPSSAPRAGNRLIC